MIDYSIIIDCPDSYLDILKVFFVFLEKNWKTRTSKIYITTQESEIKCPDNVEFIKCGFGANSIQRSKKAIEKINSKYLLILDCDDFIIKPISELEIDELLQFADLNDIKYIRVWITKNREQKLYKTSFKHLYFCNKKARYSKSLMANFWEKEEYLKVFYLDDADGWSVEGEWLKQTRFEQKGFYESYCYYSNNPFHILHAVSKGKWIRNAYRYMIRHGIKKKYLSNRGLLSIKDTIKFSISMFFINHFSSSFCYRLKKFTKRGIKFTSDY